LPGSGRGSSVAQATGSPSQSWARISLPHGRVTRPRSCRRARPAGGAQQH
jgi:hypothetical protein